jgi:hypothetical protein
VDIARIHDERIAFQVELRALVSALVDLEQEAIVGEELTLDRLRIARQLLELAALDREPVELPRPREVRRDEQPRAVAGPRQRVGLAELEEVSEARQGSRGRARG